VIKRWHEKDKKTSYTGPLLDQVMHRGSLCFANIVDAVKQRGIASNERSGLLILREFEKACFIFMLNSRGMKNKIWRWCVMNGG